MTVLLSTPSQTVGPFLSIGMTWERGEYVVPEGTPNSFWICGRLLDGAGEPVPDGVIETWQADPGGVFAHHAILPAPAGQGPGGPGGLRGFGGFRGVGRSMTGPAGEYGVLTVKPGRVADGAGGLQAPHLDVSVFARGLLHRLITRLYFADETVANDCDPVLSGLADDRARATLIATPDSIGGYALDVRLQGDDETVFFAV